MDNILEEKAMEAILAIQSKVENFNQEYSVPDIRMGCGGGATNCDGNF